MSLVQYKKKRKFDKTSEPSGSEKSSGKGALTFVIQRHKASRLHYDFRLEMDGVLKSWAVPKGPSLNPEDKRLAMMVEDHPLNYANFEGIIPKGQYGGGTVMVWDRGVYRPYDGKSREEQENILLEQLKKGHLTFIMLGKKLKGEFALVKIHGSDENAWLLIKKSDEYASKSDILKKDKSVLSDRSMDEIAKQAIKKNEVWNSKPKELKLEYLPKEKLPHQIKPMLAETVDKAFEKKGWLFEMKWDGYRTIAEIDSGAVHLYSRNGQSFDEKFAEVSRSLKKFPGNAVLDGEAVVVDKEGKPNFGWLQDYPKSKQGELIYYVFDILHYDGYNMRNLPLIERKELLKKILPDLANVKYSDHIEEHGEPFFKQAQKHNLEGIIAKDSKSIYKLDSRSFHWLKIKTGLREEAIICGYTEGKGGRKHFGALVLGIMKQGKLKYIGHTGGGFDEKLLESTLKKLEPLKADKCPFETKPQTNAPVTWIKPELTCEVSFKEWTKDGQMRQPIFVGLIEEKASKHPPHPNPTEAPLELPLKGEGNSDIETVPSPSREKVRMRGTPSVVDASTTIGKRKLNLVNLNKIFWPKEKYTKGDLINYYCEIAPIILPHLKDRPQSLLRYPDGIEGESFFQKNVSNLKLDWMMRARIKHDKETVEYMLVSDKAALIYLINLGCIDLNPWSSRIHKLDYPDYLVIDLDPVEISFEKVVETALACRKVLESLGIESCPKTSGATGMHIYIPMGAKYNYEQVKNFAHLLCIKINEQIPEITSLERNPKNRKRKVYLDFLQNNRGQTLASVYSARPKPEAPVSTPLKWNEVIKTLRPEDFTIKNIPARLQKHGDLFEDTLGKGIDIKKILRRLI